MNSPTRPTTWAEFSSKPAGVSIKAIRRGSFRSRTSASKMRPPARDVSPEPRNAILPGAMSVGCGDQLIYYLEHLLVGRDILHRIAVMGITDVSISVHHAVQGHAAQLEEVDLLPVLQGNRVIGIRQANEGNPFILP